MEKVDPLIIELIDSWTTIPAFVMSPTLEVLAANRLATALTPRFSAGTNLAKVTFFDIVERDGVPRTLKLTELVVDLLRDRAERDPETLELRYLVGELSSRSDEFAQRWAAAEPADDQMQYPITHPEFGELLVHFHHLELPGDTPQTLVVGRVDPDSDSEKALQRLIASLAAKDAADQL